MATLLESPTESKGHAALPDRPRPRPNERGLAHSGVQAAAAAAAAAVHHQLNSIAFPKRYKQTASPAVFRNT